MTIRLIVIFLIIVIGMFFIRYKNRFHSDYSARKWYVIIISIILILQSGLRHIAVGADTFAYLRFFDDVTFMSWSEIRESIILYYTYDIGKDPGYFAFQKLFQYISYDYQLFLLFIALIFFGVLGNFLLKNTKIISDLIIAFVIYSALFYSFFSITGHRQTIATAAALFGFELIKQRRLIPFIILLLISSTIHRSVLIFIPLYFLYNIRNVKYLLFGVLILFPVIFTYRIPISDYFKDVGGYEHYEIYEGAGTFTFTFVLLSIGLVALWRYNNTIRANPDAIILFITLALSIFFTPLSWVNPSAMRVVQYFSIFLLLLIPAIINSFDYDMNRHKGVIYLLVIVLLLVLIVRSNMDGGHSSMYRFFWQDMQLGPHY